MLKAIVFDFDGIIVDSEPLHYHAFLRILRPLGVDFDYQRYLKDYVGFDDRDLFRTIFTQRDMAMEDGRLMKLVTAKSAAFKEVVCGGVTSCRGVIELIKSIDNDLPLAICSGALKSDIDLVLPAIDDGKLAGRFKLMVTADDVAHSKPDPSSYVLAAEKLGVEPELCLAIEDTAAGLASARGAGMKTLGVATTYSADQLTGADRAVESLADVTVDQIHQWFD